MYFTQKETDLLKALQTKPQSTNALASLGIASKSFIQITLRTLERFEIIDSKKDTCKITNRRVSVYRLTKKTKEFLSKKEVA